jgi:hypothetical protein
MTTLVSSKVSSKYLVNLHPLENRIDSDQYSEQGHSVVSAILQREPGRKFDRSCSDSLRSSLEDLDRFYSSFSCFYQEMVSLSKTKLPPCSS